MARKLLTEKEQRSDTSDTSSSSDSTATTKKSEFATLLTETERALDDILLHNITECLSEAVPAADDVRRLSVDELLAPRPSSLSSSTNSTTSSLGCIVPPDKVNCNSVEGDDATLGSPAALELRQWLAAADPPRAAEYGAYARCFEAQGFQSLADLAELAEDEVEHAMSEVGIVKFAHRARLRKAILRLCSAGTQTAGPDLGLDAHVVEVAIGTTSVMTSRNTRAA